MGALCSTNEVKKNEVNREPKFILKHKNQVFSVIELSNGILASSNNTIIIWDSEDNYKQLHVLEGHSAAIYKLIQLKNGMIASASAE